MSGQFFSVGSKMLVILVFTWLLEAIGSGTGVPFGDYQYTGRLPLQLAGVPLVIPEINNAELSRHRGIVACPNCTTIDAVLFLKNSRGP